MRRFALRLCLLAAVPSLALPLLFLHTKPEPRVVLKCAEWERRYIPKIGYRDKCVKWEKRDATRDR